MRCLIASLPVLALACGGSVSPIDPSSLKIEGSYDFTVTDLTVTNQQGCCYQPPISTHPAVGQHARLDIRKNGTGFDAVITPEFADPAAMTVTVGTDGTVTLEGQVTFNGATDVAYASASDELAKIRLAVGSDGKLAGTFTADGQENIFEGDVGWNGQAAASGAIGADTRAPQAQANVIGSAQTVLLPWDTLYARISEPVDQKALASAITLSPSTGNANVSWQIGTGAIDWLGGVSLTGYRTSWSDFSGKASLGVAGGLVDPSGNASSTIGMPLQFLDVPKGASFGDGTAPAMWGAAQVANTPAACGTAASCVEIGPLDGPCAAQPGGIAGRLDATGGTKLEITFRARATSQYGQPYMMGGIGVQVAAPGSAAQWASDQALNPKLVQTTDTQYPYASDWITVDLPLPASGSEIGFSVVPFGTMSSYCGGGPALPPITLVLDVAKVAVVP